MTLFTVGYGGRRPDDLAALLLDHGVKTVVDVRLRPDRASVGAFAKAGSPEKGIEGLLARSGIAYRSLPELGNVFRECEDWRDRYRELLERAGELLVRRLGGLAEPLCLLCAERRADECHRALIADFLARSGEPEIRNLE